MSPFKRSVTAAPVGYHDFGLLALRVLFGGMLLLRHGLEKMMNFSRMAAHFPDPLHVGSKVSLLLVVLAEVVGSLLVILGLFTRVAALILVIELAVAFSLVHHFRLAGQGNGEMALVYLCAFLVLMLTGPGRWSIDANRR